MFSYRITFRLSTRPCLASQVLKTEMKYVQIKQQMHHDRKTRVFGIRNKTNAQKQIHLKHVWFFSARIHLKTDWTCRQSKENQRLHTASQFPQGANSSFTHLSSMTLNKARSTNKNEIPQEHYRLWLSLSYVQCFTATSQTQHPFLKGAKKPKENTKQDVENTLLVILKFIKSWNFTRSQLSTLSNRGSGDPQRKSKIIQAHRSHVLKC